MIFRYLKVVVHKRFKCTYQQQIGAAENEWTAREQEPCATTNIKEALVESL